MTVCGWVSRALPSKFGYCCAFVVAYLSYRLLSLHPLLLSLRVGSLASAVLWSRYCRNSGTTAPQI